MINIIKDVFVNIPGVFVFQYTKKPLPTPFGVEIENEGDDLVYLGSELDKLSMRSDCLRVFKDLDLTIKDAKYEQASKAN